MTDVDLENGFIKEPIRYGRRLHNVFATESFGSSGEKMNRLVLVSGGGEDGCRIWVREFELFFRISVRRSR